jgi:hypothetical protein
MSGGGRPMPAALLATATLALAACGGGEEPEEGGEGLSEAAVQDAGLRFARCMREHGIDMPDPQPGRGGLRGLLVDGDRTNDPGFRKAESDCRKHLQGLVSEIDEGQRREFEEARLEFARCMREKGFDVPDPARGGGQQGAGLGELDLEDPRVQEAMDGCREGVPGFGGG